MGSLVRGCVRVLGVVLILIVATIVLSRLGVRRPAELVSAAIDGILGCRETTLQSVSSPDSRYLATEGLVDCWDSVIGVGLGTNGEPAATSILGITDRGAEERQVHLRWLDNRTLEVTYSGRPEMVYHEDLRDWNGVHIVYIQVPPKG